MIIVLLQKSIFYNSDGCQLEQLCELPTFRMHMLDSGFYFLIAKPTIHGHLDIFCKYLLLHRAEYQTNELCAACQKVFQQIF